MAQEITKYEVMFTIHTGITLLIPKLELFDQATMDNIFFKISEKRDIELKTPSESLIIKDLKTDYLEEAAERGFIMLYELEDDEVVRCTPCQIASQ